MFHHTLTLCYRMYGRILRKQITYVSFLQQSQTCTNQLYSYCSVHSQTCSLFASTWNRHHKKFSLQLHVRNSSTKPNKNRLKALTYATYMSGTIGLLLLSAIAYRYYGRFQKRARGIEELDVPLYGRRSRVFCKYRGYVIPTDVINTVINDIPWFEVRPDDVWVVSFPKSGTTWLQEIVYLISTDHDYEKAAAVNIDERFPYLEYFFPGLKEVAKTKSPRFIKSHLPFSLMPKQLDEKKPKVIYIVRNPKDTAVSLNAFIKNLTYFNFQGSMDDFTQLFVDGIVLYGPWEKHVQEAWERRHDDSVLFVFYEDLHKDFRGTVKEIAHFLGKPISEAQLAELEQHCSFRSMQHNKSVNYSWEEQRGMWREGGQFMRKGEVGDWKNHLTQEMSTKVDAMAAKLEPLGLQFVDSF